MPHAPAPTRFGVFEWDPAGKELRKRGIRISVPGQSLAILGMLLEHAGEVVTREEIQHRLWPDGTVVEFEHSVSSAVNRLRSALGDSATTPRYVETLPRKGYRFAAPVDAPDAEPGPPGRKAGRLWTMWAAGVLLLAIGGFLAWEARRETATSIAVLPFVNLSGDAGQEHLVEGLTEELITRLSQTPALLVVSHTSAMRYQGVKTSVRQIARELGVGAVVEGSMQWSGGRVRVTAQLIDAATDRHVWSRSYDRNVSDVLALRDDIAKAIAQELKIHLAVRGPASVIPEAYEAFLKGKYFAARFTPQGQARAVDYFEQSVRLDASYAPAWAGLSHAIGYLEFWKDLPSGERCLAAMRRALDLDPTLPEAQINFADVTFYNEWKWAEGERAFRKIVEQAPGSADARDHYAVCLRALGRYQEAVDQAAQALRLDPLSPGMTSGLGTALWAAGRREEGIEMFRRAIELDGSHAVSYRSLGSALEEGGKPAEALEAYLKGEALDGQSPEACNELRRVYEQNGLRGFARARAERRIGDLRERAKSARVSPKAMAQAYLGIGDLEQALSWLEEAYRQRCPTMALLKTDRRWALARGQPRFEAVLRKMGLK